MRYLYFYGSYFYSHADVILSINNKKKSFFNCMTIGSSAYTFTYLLLSPVMLPVHLCRTVYNKF